MKMNKNEKSIQNVTQKQKQFYNTMSIRQRNILNRSKIKRKRMYPHKPLLKKNLFNLKSNIQPDKISLPVVTSDQVVKLEKNNQDIEDDIDIEASGNDYNSKSTSTDDIIENTSKLKNESIKSPIIHSSLTTLDMPFEEYIYYDISLITDQEKHFVFEFFEGRPTKTPERYLKIRNHILNCWNNSKPNYVTKTFVRCGLKNCGDVNSIGKIHTYLEQIAAINFECENVGYVRPLSKLLIPTTVNKHTNTENKISENKVEEIHSPRQKRNKRLLKFNREEGGGYTFEHDETGEIIETTIINNDDNTSRKPNTRKPVIKLICCKSFSPEMPAPYVVKISISALLHMDWHAHSSFDEVMGLLGGIYDQRLNILYIKRYVPCESVTNSHVHCDMCPISQSIAQESLQNDNLQVVGWYHSHPTFAANPSEQDVETQLNMQKWMQRSNNDLPLFVGIILSPFTYYKNSTHMSDYQCIIIKTDMDTGGEIVSVPYKFQTSIISNDINTGQLIQDLKYLFNEAERDFDLLSPYVYDTSITFLDKMITSTKFHLLKCSGFIESTCDTIINEIQKLKFRNS